MELDEVLSEVGQFGWYQWKVCFLIMWPLVFSAYASIGYIFSAKDLDYRCRLDGCENGTYSNSWTAAGIPISTNGFPEHCDHYIRPNNGSCTFDKSLTVPCNNDFVFRDPKQTSIVTTYGIYCRENKWKLTFVGTLCNIGQFIGLPIAGFVSDRLGRKTMIVWSLVLSGIIGFFKTFSPFYYVYVFLEMLEAIVGCGIYSAGFIMGTELTGPRRRVIASSFLSASYSFGEIIMGCWAWLLGDWKLTLRVVYAPSILFIIYFWFLPESLRWLLNKGKTDEAIRTLEEIGKQNHKPLSEATKNKFRKSALSDEKINIDTKTELTPKPKVWPLKEVLQSRKMLLRLANCSFSWMTHTLVFYGLSINSASVAGNQYLNFILVSVAEIPGYIAAAFIMDILGRRMSLSTSLGLSAVSCLFFHFCADEAEWIRLMLFFSGKCAITCSFNVIYMYTAEMFPTNLRHSLLGFCSMFGRIGSMIAPQAPLLALYVDPMLVLGSVALLASGLALFFPETNNKPLPDSVYQAQEIDAK